MTQQETNQAIEAYIAEHGEVFYWDDDEIKWESTPRSGVEYWIETNELDAEYIYTPHPRRCFKRIGVYNK